MVDSVNSDHLDADAGTWKTWHETLAQLSTHVGEAYIRGWLEAADWGRIQGTVELMLAWRDFAGAVSKFFSDGSQISERTALTLLNVLYAVEEAEGASKDELDRVAQEIEDL